MLNPETANLKIFIGHIIGILQSLIPVIFALTFVVLLWKIIDAWILHGDDPSSVEEGKRTAAIGVIALVIMSGVWGILALLRASLFY